MSNPQVGPVYQTRAPFGPDGGNGVIPPFFFSRGGTNPTGTYLKTGDVITSNAGQQVPGLNFIVKIKASLSSVVATTTRIQFQRRTGVSTFVDITDAWIDIPAGEYSASRVGIAVPTGPDWELAAYVLSGSSVSNPVVGIFLIPQ